MKKIQLTGEYKKQADALLEQCMREMEKKVPESRETFDQKPDVIRNQIAQEYIQELLKIREEAIRAGCYTE